MLKNLLVFILLLHSFVFLAQRETANWYFGFNAGIDFNSGNPSFLNNSGINTIECSSAISNSNGDLLFYTDGERIYNREFNTMSNGSDILGHKSSTSGAVIVPDPGASNLYYVFTSDAVQHYQESTVNPQGKGLNYSIVDLSLNGGLGEVIDKNINMIPEASEKLSVVKNQDGSGYWIVTHFNDSIYVFSLTATGISGPIITTIGPEISDFNNIRGWIKFSPDGTKLAIAHSIFEPFLTGLLIVYDFDNETGMLSNEQIIGSDLVFYGVEFSSNSERLYSSAKVPLPGGVVTGNIQIFQYDLLSANIEASQYLIREIESDALSDVAGALQLGLDCKIYYSNANSQVSVFSKPNRDDEFSEFRLGAVNLGAGSSSLGLPAMNQSYFDNIIEFTNLCSDEEAEFFLNTSSNITTVAWDFGDPSSASNFSNLLNPTHQFTSSGVFEISAQVTFSNGETRIYNKILNIIDSPNFNDTVLRQCDTDGIDDGLSLFNVEESIPNIVPEDLLTSVQVTFFETLSDAQLAINPIDPLFYENSINNQIIYAKVDATLDCSIIVEVTLQVQADSIPPVREKDICGIVGSQEDVDIVLNEIRNELEVDYPGLEITFYPTLNDAIAEINNLDVNPIDTLNNLDGLYYRVEDFLGCIAVGFYSLNIISAPEINNVDVVLCDPSDGVQLSFQEQFVEYNWDTGETSPSIIVFEAGTYTVNVKNSAGCEAIASFFVSAAPQFDVEITVNDFQQQNSITIEVTTQEDVLYSIDNGFAFQKSNIFSGLAPGYYNLIVKDTVGCNEIEQLVLVRGAPRYFTPNGDGINDFWHVKEVQNYPGLKINIMDRYGKWITSLDSNSEGWDGTYGGVLMPSNSYWYRIDYEGQNYYGYFSLIRRAE